MYAYERTKTPNGPCEAAHLADRLRPVVVVAEPLAVADDRRHRQERLQASRTAIGPPPGPPPPCGCENVLCRLKWTMSKPMSPGREIPQTAFRFAPS